MYKLCSSIKKKNPLIFMKDSWFSTLLYINISQFFSLILSRKHTYRTTNM